MLIFLPIHSSVPGLETLAKDILRKGALKDHHLRICSTREDEEIAYLIGDAIQDGFKSVTTVTLAATPKPRNPVKLANDMFFAAVQYLYKHVPEPGQPEDVPMLYLTTDARPTTRNWADMLQAEFYLKNAPPVMARTVSSGSGNTFKRLTEGPVILGSKFRSTMLDFLDDREHWRQRMCHELAQNLVETRQIGSGAKSLLKQVKLDKVKA